MRLTMIRLLAMALFLASRIETNAQTQAQPNQPADQAVNVQAMIQGLTLSQPQVVTQPTVWNVNYALDLANSELSLAPASDALRAQLSLPKNEGLIVTGLAANAPAAQAGIQQDDVLLKLDEASLAKADDLEIGLKAAGEKPASLTILRAGKKLKVQVQPRVRVSMGPVQPALPAFWIGISVSPLEPALRSQLKLPQNQGLLAIEVIKDSPAAKAEVKIHDILLSLAGKPLESQEKLVELVQSNGEKTVPLEIIREGKNQTIEVTPQRRKADELLGAALRRAETHYYQLVRPGALVTVDQFGGVATVDEKGGWIVDAPNRIATNRTQSELVLDPKSPSNAGAAGSRLDEIDTDVKQLRKAIEELTKTLKDKK